MKRIHHPLVLLFVALTLILPYLTVPEVAARKWGWVAAKGRVLDQNGNPIWAEFGADGSVVRRITAEDPNVLYTARVMPAADYHAYVQAFEAIIDQYGAVSEVLSREDYDNRIFTRPDGGAINKPGLAADTAAVVVRLQHLIYDNNIELLLHQSPLDLTRPTPIPDSAQAVLLSEKGQVITTSDTNIGYQTAFYTLKDSTDHYQGVSRAGMGRMAYRVNTPGYQWGQDSMFGFNPVEDQLRGPMMDVQVDGWFDTNTTDKNGYFVVNTPGQCIYIPSFMAQARLRYNIWDPQVGMTGVYLLTRYASCTANPPLKIEVDVAIVTGQGIFINPSVGVPSYVDQGETTTYAYAPPPLTPLPAADGRVADIAPDLSDQGLLATICEDDIDKTDIYVFRASNGMLITSRKGLSGHEWIPKYSTSQYGGGIAFHMMIRAGGNYGDSVDLGMATAGKITSMWDYDTFQKVTNVHESLRPRNADHLRTGEKVKVVLVNRATGYIGTGTGTVGEKFFTSAEGVEVQCDSVDISMGQIRMGPPNLKIRARREYDVQAGLTKDESRQHIIGFEGSGLSSDRLVAITTEWYDMDGTPLPAGLPGYTGRLAKVVGTNKLAPADNKIVNFAIKPGTHLQLVRLPQKDLDNDHFYVHVSGEPQEGNPDFSETGAVDNGALQYRPAHYVPVKVPVYNEASTHDLADPIYSWVYRPEMQFSVYDLEIQQADRDIPVGEPSIPFDTVLPYSYGGEINFDFLLSSSALNPLPLLGPFPMAQPEDPNDPVDPLLKERTLVFGIGDREYQAVIDAQGQVHFDNVHYMKELAPEDLLTVRLYQNGDDPNALWEYTSTKIRVEFEKKNDPNGCKLLQGESLILHGTTLPAGRALSWTPLPEKTEKGVLVNIIPLGGTDPARTMIYADEETGSGWYWVRVADRQNPHVFLDKAIYVGCGCEDCQAPGAAEIKKGSVNVRFSLGKTDGGVPAGDLFLLSKQLRPELATPRALYLNKNTDDVEVLQDFDQGLRQIMTPQALVDIVVVSDFAYELRFYAPSAVGEPAGDGLYDTGGASPFVTWRIANQDASADTCNNLAVTEIRDGKSTANVFGYDQGTDSWTLSNGNGARQETFQEQTIAGGDRVVTTELRNGSGELASTLRTTWRPLRFGQAMIEQVVDPGGAALTTSLTYYENQSLTGSYGRVASRVNPDGSWVKYHYDTAGRLTSEESGWLDLGAGTSAGGARMVSYDYTPVDPQDSQLSDDKYRPRTTTETIQGTLVAKTFYAYIKDSDGQRIEITERCADPAAGYGDSANLRTVNTYYPVDSAENGRIKTSQSADGRLETYTYEYGTWDGSQFIAGSGRAQRTTAVQGTVGQPDGIADKTTATVTIADALGRTVRSETQIYTAGGHETVNWTSYTYDAKGHQTGSVSSDGTSTSSIWNCCGKESDTDAAGIQTSYSYDDLKRVQTATRHLASGDITTDYTYDAAGRTLTRTVTAGGLTMSTASTYDSAGRLKTSTDTAGRTTIFDYSAAGRTTTVTRPGGITEITTRFLDGKTKSVTGTGAVAQYYSYGVNTDGSRWSRVATATSDSPAYQLTTTDLLGRTLSTEQPGAGGTVTTAQYYDTDGRLSRTTTTGQADTLYVYDELSNPTRSGLDIDANGVLETASADRISDTDTSYTQMDGAWWQQTTQKVYAAADDATATTAAIQRQRITGLGGGLIAETVAVDIHGNTTVSRTTVNQAAQRRTQTVDYPDSTIDAQSVTVGGLLVSSTTKSGLTTTFAYDALGRRTGVTDPRTGTATTHYDDLGQVDWVEDSANHHTEFTYDPVTGRKTGQTDALGKVTRFAYNDRGQVTHTWGDVPYPVQYQYDAFGRMSAMTTYRTDEGFAADSFPASAVGDTTTWHYDEATGQLTAKEYADSSQVTYTYTPAGKLETRTWARQDGGAPLTTTYGYDPATGELQTIDYSDATADIAFTYDRLGRQEEITDAVGTRTFAYNAALQLESETVTGLYNATLTRTYDATVPGRAAGFDLGAGYSVAYGYDATTGRFQSVTWNAAGQSDTATYGYLANSDLLEQVTTTTGRQTTYGFEPDRNLKTSVRNDFNGATVSQYDYVYDAVGRRTSAANTGSAFGQAAFDAYNYNDRSELIASDRYLGTDIFDTSSPIADRQRGYLYDPIGNRTEAEEAGTTTNYAANALNQYTMVGANAPVYDADGNMTSTPDGMAYTFNAENRLIAAQPQSPADGDTRTEYVYDYMGRRVQKTVYTYETDHWTLITDHQFLYDGWNLIKETTTPDGGSSVDRYYVWGLDLSQSLQGAGGVGGLLATIDGSLTYQYLYDANGNVGQLVDAADGSIAARYEYDPYGNLTDLGGAYVDANAYRFSTKFFDSENNLYYYGYRYYSPQLGRWITRDPIGEKGGKNLFVITKNAPVNMVDYKGLCDIKQRTSKYGGFEYHFFGGFGLTMVECCNEKNELKYMYFTKVCFGGAVGASAGGGVVKGLNGINCISKNYRGWFAEYGASLGPANVGHDIGLESASQENWYIPGDANQATGVTETGAGMGTGVGLEVKATFCYYMHIEGQDIVIPCGCSGCGSEPKADFTQRDYQRLDESLKRVTRIQIEKFIARHPEVRNHPEVISAYKTGVIPINSKLSEVINKL